MQSLITNKLTASEKAVIELCDKLPVILTELQTIADQISTEFQAIADQISAATSNDRIVNRHELAKIMGCSASTVDNMARAGIIPFVYVGPDAKTAKRKYLLAAVLAELERQGGANHRRAKGDHRRGH